MRVTSQAELDKALADGVGEILIVSPADVWIELRDTGSATVWAYDSATVRAYGSATVRAYDSATVMAYGSATVQASKYVAVRLHSARVTLDGGVLIDLTQLDLTDPTTWCDYHGVTVTDGIAEVFKAVNDQWTTDQGTNYQPGSLPTAPDWKPTRECGHGLHFCARPAVSKDQYFPSATKFVRVGVRLDEMVCLGDKIKAPRVVSPCTEVDIHGQVVSQLRHADSR